MELLTKEQFNKHLYEYYVENYGERDTDIWHEQPAVNVLVFERNGKFITLKSHVLTGKVTERID